jgi:fido (protein-threonine AMPylation protein)
VTAETRALERAREALARLEKAASRVRCLDLVLYRSARIEAIRRGDAFPEHAPGVPAVDPAEQPPIAAVLRGEAWLAGGRPGGWRGLVCDLHWELMQGCDPAPGSLRTGTAWQGGPDPAHARHRYPEAREVPRLFAAIERTLRAERDPLLLAADALAQLALLHPFRNGNGRVAQALVAVVLRERGLCRGRVSAVGGARPRRRYFTAIDRYQLGDRQPWVAFFLSAIERAATDAAAACEAIRARLEADERRLPEGDARRLLRRLAEGALPLRAVARGREDGLRALRGARIAKVVPGLFDEPIVFHVGLARIVAGGTGSRRVSSTR